MKVRPPVADANTQARSGVGPPLPAIRVPGDQLRAQTAMLALQARSDLLTQLALLAPPAMLSPLGRGSVRPTPLALLALQALSAFPLTLLALLALPAPLAPFFPLSLPPDLCLVPLRAYNARGW